MPQFFPVGVVMASDSTSANSSSNDFDAFCDFLVQMRQQGTESLTPEQSVEEFRNHQHQLRVWNERNKLSQQQANRGDAEQLDDQAVLGRLRERLDRDRNVE